MPQDSFTKEVGYDAGEPMIPGEKVVDPKNELLADCIVKMHVAVRDLNKKLMKSAKKFNYISPRDFLDFIRHFLSLKAAKHAELVE